MSKHREFWMDTDLLNEALDNCDLGDGYSAKVRQYPHKDMLSELTHVIEYAALEQAMKRIEILEAALEEILNEVGTSTLANKIASHAIEQSRKLGE